MTTNKTLPVKLSVKAFVDSLSDERRQNESRKLIQIMTRVSGEKPAMWGPSIVGFGSFHYKYESGREGDQLLIGFSPRKAAISIYGIRHALEEMNVSLEALGQCTAGKGCVYVKKLEAIDLTLLEKVLKKAAVINSKIHK